MCERRTIYKLYLFFSPSYGCIMLCCIFILFKSHIALICGVGYRRIAEKNAAADQRTASEMERVREVIISSTVPCLYCTLYLSHVFISHNDYMSNYLSA